MNFFGKLFGVTGRQLAKNYVAPVVYAKSTPLYYVNNDLYMPEIYLILLRTKVKSKMMKMMKVESKTAKVMRSLQTDCFNIFQNKTFVRIYVFLHLLPVEEVRCHLRGGEDDDRDQVARESKKSQKG